MTRLPAKPKVPARHCWMFPAQKALRGSVNSKFTEPLFAELDCVVRSWSSDSISSHIKPAGRAKVLDSEHRHDLCRIVSAQKTVAAVASGASRPSTRKFANRHTPFCHRSNSYADDSSRWRTSCRPHQRGSFSKWLDHAEERLAFRGRGRRISSEPGERPSLLNRVLPPPA